eukprot:SAG22_NODE_92_length_20892_cov_11.188429_3_plen_494_part_00
MQCSVPGDGDPVVTIAEGYAELNYKSQLRPQTVIQANDTVGQMGVLRHFFACPYGKLGCGSASMHGLGTSPAVSCNPGYTGLLCSACESGWAQTSTNCVECSSNDVTTLAIGVISTLVVVLVLSVAVGQCSNNSNVAALILWAGVLQRVWPRMSQSWRILVGNYQILARIPMLTGVQFPSPLSDVIDAFASVAELAIDSVPSVACTFGGSFFRRLIIRISIPVVLLLSIAAVHKLRTCYLVAHQMPIVDTNMKLWRAKVARALVRNQLINSAASQAFAVIYLMYPSVSAAIMSTFKCRKLTAGGLCVLADDHGVVCFDQTGSLDPDYLRLVALGVVLCLLWTVGVPVLFARQLYKNRATILAGNHSYAGVSYLRPLFMFMHPECYMFELIFMLEKFLLVAVVGLLRVYVGGYFVVTLLAMVINGTVLCFIVHYRPSKTTAYNTANIISHCYTLLILYITIALKCPMPEVRVTVTSGFPIIFQRHYCVSFCLTR